MGGEPLRLLLQLLWEVAFVDVDCGDRRRKKRSMFTGYMRFSTNGYR